MEKLVQRREYCKAYIKVFNRKTLLVPFGLRIV